ncbi:MAG: hypothetical protein ACYDBH_01035 [Acidobacteriaceae bacterium]
MRTYGRIYSEDGSYNWIEVSTDANGNNDNVYLTTLCQVLRLGLGESPFFANYGIPAQQTVVTQVFPDFYVAQTQQQFAPFFKSIAIFRVPSKTPTYNISVLTHSGAILTVQVAQ